MQVVYARCAGLDVHKKTVSACITVCEDKRKAATDAGVRNVHTRLAEAGGLAEGARSNSRSHGSYRSLLATGMGDARRTDAGEPAPHEGGTGT